MGDQLQSSLVTINDMTIEAAPGCGSDEDYFGGDGYSGGGAWGFERGNDGGSDGGDGQDDFNYDGGRGGVGSGVNISSLKMLNFELTPGKGGDYYWDNSLGFYYGGGGGGVLVNGEGPERDSYTQGQGYGGGAGRHSQHGGLQGVVLLEVSSEKKQIL